jgi:UDP-N-acetylglucosamine--N-acetylmuramyl-(pentapeptide) pyrophosphoryl-undecaprenol N-acetylglucosamine transferase
MKRIIISGGGTGGHVFPAIAIADALKAKLPDAGILFIGAKGKLEMEKVPAAGYKIEGLPIAGFQRRLTWKNLLFPFRLLSSMFRAWRIVGRFKPDLAVGVGGYASGPVLRVAAARKIPCMVQEQNSYPGITNRVLGSKVARICVAYEGMEKFFPREKLVLTGNPIRQDIKHLEEKREEAIRQYMIGKGRITVLVIGGSLGAGTINKSVMECIRSGKFRGRVQWIWQCGKYYYATLRAGLDQAGLTEENENFSLRPFIDRMDLAYAAADVVISRAGAIAISELCMAGKPSILVPSPNVAEDHQTKNATALTNRKAAMMVRDAEALEKLGDVLEMLISDEKKRNELCLNIREMAVPDAAERIASVACELMNENR